MTPDLSDVHSEPSTPILVTNAAGPNASFDALIDLLASDDPLEDPATTSNEAQRLVLRDASGRLDFDKIRSMFSRQRRVSEEDAQDAIKHTGTNTGSKITGPLPSEVEPGNTSPPAENRHSAPVPVLDVSHDGASGILSPNTDLDKTTLPSAPSSTAVTMDPLIRPLDFSQLNDALSRANVEVEDLRRRYDDLQMLVSERLPRRVPSMLPASAIPGRHPSTVPEKTTPSAVQVEVSSEIDPQFPGEIAKLSEFEAKSILCYLSRALAFPPSVLVAQSGDDRFTTLPASQQPQSVEDIRRSVDFLRSVDEVVWRRSTASVDRPAIFSEDNVNALSMRVALWEQTVRGSHKT
ncbi:hypothetical protein BV22DRAFT_1126286 [Leucogyrophana mollusca]|uniref:Uncharacterized protein n=1 Tax=Leucogyrophana mollusca TaxID=85980 RepID=A0ACB8BS48_9AGAM|nr:hypothetical protein BV22DRAFT_1126286 [Leucogyrophana mollusca]